jgi:hypothetical protein
MTNKDKTGTSRQRTRRLFERAWLKSQGYTSWDVIHTKLMNGELTLKGKTLQDAADERRFYESMRKS